MKIFWSFIALLVLVTVTLALFPGLTERLNGTELQVAKNDTARSVPMSAEVPVMSTPDDGDTSNKSQGVDADKAKEDEPELNEQAKGSLAILLDPDSSEESVDVTLPVVNPGAVDGAEDGDDALLIENEAKADPEDQGNPLKDEESTDIDSAKPVETPEAEIKTTDPAIDANAQVVSSKGEEAVAESKDEKTPPWEEADQKPQLDDDIFEIKGSGTREDPYRVTWELLTSAYESYRPREKKTDIPDRIMNLHEKYVRISGYLAFPMMTGEVTEALVMLNQWDGCCLGVPPSPYDSIEVTLTESVVAESGGGAFTPFGSVEGKLLVDPYLVNGWLVGLYLMEKAKLQNVG